MEVEYAASDCHDGQVRLVGGPNKYEGIVELCINRMWGTICTQEFRNFVPFVSLYNRNEANLLCRQLGHQNRGVVVLSPL